MTPEAFEAAALALPATSRVVQWGGASVYKVGDRIFAIAGLGGAMSLKVTDIAYAVLTETGAARPAPYLARAKWVAFDDLAGLEDGEVSDWLVTAHALVSARMTARQRRDLGLKPGL